MIRIIFVKNQLKIDEREIFDVQFCQDKTVLAYLDDVCKLGDDIPVVITSTKRGQIKLKDTVEDGDQILVVCKVEGFETLIAIGGWLLKTVAMAAVGYGISMAVNAIMGKPKQPNFNSGTGGIDEGSPTYSFEGIQTTEEVGIPVPIVYGEHRVGGNKINQYIRNDGDKNYLNMLIALCEGEIESISDIQINDNPADNYDGITTDYKLGTNTQDVIANFGDAHNVYNVAVDLNTLDADHVYTTADSDVEGFEVILSLTGGLYQQTSNGDIKVWSVTYQVEYKLHADGSYTDLGEITITEKNRSAFSRAFRKDGLTAGQYDIRVTRTSEASSLDPLKQGDLRWTQVDEIKTDDYSYPNTALLSIEALATEQLSGSAPSVTCVVKGSKVSAPQVMNGESQVDWEDYYYDPEYDDNAGAYRLLSDDTVLTWDEETYVDQYCANPIWCLRDLLTNTRYGLGEHIESGDIDLGYWLEMSQHCEESVSDGDSGYEKRFRIDVVIDSLTSAMDIITQLCASFNGMPFYSDGKVYIKIDKPESPTFTFGMGNIIKGSFSQQWKPYNEIFNMVDVEFVNKDSNYTREIITVTDELSLANGDPIRRKSVRAYVTSLSYAIRVGRYCLKLNKYVNEVVSFKAGIDACAVMVGDVIAVSHDVPQWGYSGRIKAVGNDGSNDIVQLDRDVDIAAATSYEIAIKDSATDTIETRDISISGSPPLTTDSLKIDGEFGFDLNPYDTYTFGVPLSIYKEFRVTSISYTNEHEVEIQAIEYDEDVYDDSAVSLPVNNVSSLSVALPAVSNFDAVERTRALSDGTLESVIELYWQRPSNSGFVHPFRGVNIYVSTDDENYDLWKYSEAESEVYSDVIVGETYYFNLVTVTKDGIVDSMDNGATDSEEVDGATSSPANVANFAYDFDKDCVLTWDANVDPHLAGYEIRLADSNWGTVNSDLIFQGLATEFTVTETIQTTRSGITYYIKAFSRGEVGVSRAYSDTAQSVTPSNSAPAAPSNLDHNLVSGMASLFWDNVGDDDILYYEVYRDNTNAWSGSEVKIGEVSGRSMTIQGNKSKAGEVDTATSTSVTDATLAGLGANALVGRRVIMTSGDADSDERTISTYNTSTGAIGVSSAFSETPSAGDTFMVLDTGYYKVRAVDVYGVGTLTAAETINFDWIDEDMLGDKTILARKIFVDSLSAISANIGTMTAGTIIGLMIKSASSGSRIEFDDEYFKAYDGSDNVVFQINLTGADAGDVIFGDVGGTDYIKWDASAGTLIMAAVSIQSGDYVAETTGYKISSSVFDVNGKLQGTAFESEQGEFGVVEYLGYWQIEDSDIATAGVRVDHTISVLSTQPANSLDATDWSYIWYTGSLYWESDRGSSPILIEDIYDATYHKFGAWFVKRPGVNYVRMRVRMKNRSTATDFDFRTSIIGAPDATGVPYKYNLRSDAETFTAGSSDADTTNIKTHTFEIDISSLDDDEAYFVALTRDKYDGSGAASLDAYVLQCMISTGV